MRRVKLHKQDCGPSQRLSYQEKILEDKPIVPNPLEYEDIDTEFFRYVEDTINITDENGDRIPAFTLYSNQRFSEYSQTWKHVDNDGNLLMNFLTVSRENNPNFGSIEGGNYNIPERWFTVRIREVKDENGIDCYEIISMKQPIQVDLMYRIGFFTTKYEKLNIFNTKVNDMFASKQCYLCVNGHYMPMVVDNVSDETTYGVDERKFFAQSVSVKLIGYIIPKDNIKVELKPKRVKFNMPIDKKRNNKVSLDYITDEKFLFDIEFGEGVEKIKFISEDNMILNLNKVENARKIKFIVNDEEVDFRNEFRLLEGDDVTVKIYQINQYRKSKLIFTGLTI